MIAVDTNVLVYAHREDAAFHEAAYHAIETLAEGRAAWAIPWPCIHEFLAIVTHPRIYVPPTPLPAAIDQVTAWLDSPTLVLLPEAADHWPTLAPMLLAGKLQGAQVHDARIAAICVSHGVSELWTADRDFSRFGTLKVRNPLLG